jgi:acetylornithine deacetylase/succinyl-diaminopimelate desuccinylase-like protein
VLEGLFGAVKFYRDGGSIPALALFKEHLNLYMTCFSFGLPDDNIHSPNERCFIWKLFDAMYTTALLAGK